MRIEEARLYRKNFKMLFATEISLEVKQEYEHVYSLYLFSYFILLKILVYELNFHHL